MMTDLHLNIDLESRCRRTAANILNFLIPITEFLDTKIAPAIQLTSKIKGNNTDSKYQLNGQDLW